jgi:hypothetical protein
MKFNLNVTGAYPGDKIINVKKLKGMTLEVQNTIYPRSKFVDQYLYDYGDRYVERLKSMNEFQGMTNDQITDYLIKYSEEGSDYIDDTVRVKIIAPGNVYERLESEIVDDLIGRTLPISSIEQLFPHKTGSTTKHSTHDFHMSHWEVDMSVIQRRGFHWNCS